MGFQIAELRMLGVFRHGLADKQKIEFHPDGYIANGELLPIGQEEVGLLAANLLPLVVGDLSETVLVSGTLRRTEQTAEILGEKLRLAVITSELLDMLENKRPPMSIRQISQGLSELLGIKKNLLVVTHQPFVSNLAEMLHPRGNALHNRLDFNQVVPASGYLISPDGSATYISPFGTEKV